MRPLFVWFAQSNHGKMVYFLLTKSSYAKKKPLRLVNRDAVTLMTAKIQD